MPSGLLVGSPAHRQLDTLHPQNNVREINAFDKLSVAHHHCHLWRDRGGGHLCFPVALGQLELKGALDNFLQTSGDRAPEVCRARGCLPTRARAAHRPASRSESNPLWPDLAAVSGPLYLLDQCAEPALDLVDGGLQAFFRLVKCVPMLHRELDDGATLLPPCMLLNFFYQF